MLGNVTFSCVTTGLPLRVRSSLYSVCSLSHLSYICILFHPFFFQHRAVARRWEVLPYLPRTTAAAAAQAVLRAPGRLCSRCGHQRRKCWRVRRCRRRRKPDVRVWRAAVRRSHAASKKARQQHQGESMLSVPTALFSRTT